MDSLTKILTTDIDLFWAAIVSAIVSIIVSYLFKMRELKVTLELNYEFDQMVKVRSEVGKHHGRMVAAAERLSHRLWNLHNHENEGWQVAASLPSESGYYYRTTLKRLLDFYSIVVEVEEAAIHLDARYADTLDFKFLSFCSALQSIMSDVRIGKGLNYD
jgi:hypothetical protein